MGARQNRVVAWEVKMKLVFVMARRLGRLGGIDRTGNQNVPKRCEGAF